MRGPHSVSHSAPAGSKTSTRRSSCRLRARLRRWSVSRGRAVAARSSRRCCRFDWFSLTWTIRSLPVALAISNVFLTVHGVDREDAAGQAERFDQSLDGWDLVRRLLDDFMSQDDPMIDGKSAQHMRRLSVREGIKAAPKRLAVDRDEARWCGFACMIEPLGVTSERLFQFGLVEPLEDAAHRRVGWRPPQRRTREGCVQKSEPPVHQGVDLTIRARPAQHRHDREQDHAGLPVYLPFGAPAIGNGGQAGEKIRRHEQPPSRVASMDSDRTPLGKGKNVLHGAVRAAPLEHSVEQPCLMLGPYVENAMRNQDGE